MIAGWKDSRVDTRTHYRHNDALKRIHAFSVVALNENIVLKIIQKRKTKE